MRRRYCKTLRKLLDQVESSVRDLKALKIETNSYGQLLVPLLNEKLPNDLKSDPHLPKNIFYDSSLKMIKNVFLFCLKSSFRFQDI